MDTEGRLYYLILMLPSRVILRLMSLIGSVAQSSTTEVGEEEDSERESDIPDPSKGFRGTMEADHKMGDRICANEAIADSSAASSSCPSWLRKELESAEFIPMPETPSLASLESESDKETLPYDELKGLHMAPPTPVDINKTNAGSWHLLDSAEPCSDEKTSAIPNPCKCNLLQAEVERLSGLMSKCLADQEKLHQETSRLSAQLQSLIRKTQGTQQLEAHSKATQTTKEEMEMDPKPDLDSDSWCLLGTESCRFSL